jgi:hypothetical protein
MNRRADMAHGSPARSRRRNLRAHSRAAVRLAARPPARDAHPPARRLPAVGAPPPTPVWLARVLRRSAREQTRKFRRSLRAGHSAASRVSQRRPLAEARR